MMIFRHRTSTALRCKAGRGISGDTIGSGQGPMLRYLPLVLLGALGFNGQASAQSAAAFTTVQDPPVFVAEDNVQSATGQGQVSTTAATSAARLPPARQRSILLNVGYVNSWIWNPNTGKYDRVRLRSYRGQHPGLPPVAPSIEIQPGNRLNVRLINSLPTDDPSCRNLADNSHNTPNCFNTTNLHTHGLWVDPNGISDNIFLMIKPGQTQNYEIDVPADHPAGTFWYHAHVHGSTALQVSSGMAGALIIRGNRYPSATANGDLDTLLKSTPTVRVQERVLMMQQIQYACLDDAGGIKRNADNSWKCDDGDVGVVENYDALQNAGSWRQSGRFTTVNGRTIPEFTGAVAGRLERWRMIHGGVRDTINLRFREMVIGNQTIPNIRSMTNRQREHFVNNFCTGAPLPQHLVAADGLTMGAMQDSRSTVFQPGYRWDAVMVFPRAGYYCVLDDSVPATGNINAVPARQLLGIVRVAPGTNMENSQIPGYVRQQMLALANYNAPAGVREAVVADLRDSLKLSRYAPHKTIEQSELTEPNETVTFNIGGQPGALSFEVDGKTYDPKVAGRMLKLGGVQEWHMKSQRFSHPFHIHVNPFQIVAILDPAGRDVSGFDTPDNFSGTVDTQFRGLKGVWKDTIMVKSDQAGNSYTVVARTRYQRFAGDFVLHCHILDHEDLGMMQHVRIFDPARPETRTAPVPGHDHSGH